MKTKIIEGNRKIPGSIPGVRGFGFLLWIIMDDDIDGRFHDIHQKVKPKIIEGNPKIPGSIPGLRKFQCFRELFHQVCGEVVN